MAPPRRPQPQLPLGVAPSGVGLGDAPSAEPRRIAPRPLEPSGAERPIGVGELDRRLRLLLERRTEGVWVQGEVVDLREVRSGHVYFVLRDPEEDAAIDAVLYRASSVRARRALAPGALVVVQGHATVFAPRGRLQLVVESARPAGQGAHLAARERLKAKLAAEGLFDKACKRPIPSDARVVGVVTSGDGAALFDIVRVAFRRARVRVVLARALVQGRDAPASIVNAIGLLARHPDVDVIVVGRGGGSADDLSCFHDELVVRAVATCAKPIVSAVGHETDVTLVDLAADARAATPSQAAELVTPDHRARRERIQHLSARLTRALGHEMGRRRQILDDGHMRLRSGFDRRMRTRRGHVEQLARRLAVRHPRAVLEGARPVLAGLSQRLQRAAHTQIAHRREAVAALGALTSSTVVADLRTRRESLARAAARLQAMSPLAVLSRGYAVVLDPRGRALVDATEVGVGDLLSVRLLRGALAVTVTELGSPPDVVGVAATPIHVVAVGDSEDR